MVKTRKTKKSPVRKAKSVRKKANPHMEKLAKKAEKLRKHLRASKEDKQGMIRLKQLEAQIAA